MSRLTHIGLNFRIGTKLAITSGFGIVLVAAMAIGQMVGDAAVSSSSSTANLQQELARDTMAAKAAIRGLEVNVRDLRFARSRSEFQKAVDYTRASQKSSHAYLDPLIAKVRELENRERLEKVKSLVNEYVKRTGEIGAIKTEAFALEDKPPEGVSDSEVSSRLLDLNSEIVRVVRVRIQPVADEIEGLIGKVEEFAVNQAEEQIAAASQAMAFAGQFGLGLAAVVILILIGSAVFSVRTIAKPIRALTGGMLQLADGNFDVVLPGLGRKDEIGDIAAAVEAFKMKAVEKARLDAEDVAQRQKLEADEAARRQKAEQEIEAKAAEERAKAAEEQAQVVRLLATGLKNLSEGDLTFRLNEDVSDAYRQIKDDFNAAIARLQETINSIATSAREVANASIEISTSTTDLSQRTEEQAASLEETSASLEQISATVKKNAENAQQANQFASDTRGVAGRGGEVVAQAVGAMSRIEESSRKISDIISVIDEIARQTNLLALNAAVEAARAGEAGRGFAVVATEVRSLAQRSSQAAKDIKDLITNSSTQVHDGVKLVNQTGEALTGIVESIKKVAEIVSDIAAASAEQTTGIEQINKAMTQMDEVTQQNSALVEENAAAAKTLEQQSAAMNEQVGFFRLDQTAAMSTSARPAAGSGQPAVAATARLRSPAAAKRPMPTPKHGPVGRMQATLATALADDPEWKEF